MLVILSGKNICSCDNYMKNELSEQWCFLVFYELILHPQWYEIQDANLIINSANLRKYNKGKRVNNIKFDFNN